MLNTTPSALRRPLAAGVALAAALLAADSVQAGTCPPDQVLAEPREIDMAQDVGITRETLARVDLTGWRGMGNFLLRTRRLTVAPDAIVPTHAHDDRPSIVMILNGELIEHSALCAVPIVHRAGDVTPEFGEGHDHWWENKSGETVIVLSSDLVPFRPQQQTEMPDM